MAWVSVILVPVLAGGNREDLTLSAGTYWKYVCAGECATATRWLRPPGELAALSEGVTPGLIICAITG